MIRMITKRLTVSDFVGMCCDEEKLQVKIWCALVEDVVWEGCAWDIPQKWGERELYSFDLPERAGELTINCY